MPILTVKLSSAPSEITRRRVAEILTEMTADILGKKREVTAVIIEPVAAGYWFIAGRSLAEVGQNSFQLDIKITEGTNSKDQKAAYVRQVYSAMESLLGPLAPASYIVIDEVRADAWGFQGQTQENRYIRGKEQ